MKYITFILLLFIVSCGTDAMDEMTEKEKCIARGGEIMYNYPVIPPDNGWTCYIRERNTEP